MDDEFKIIGIPFWDPVAIEKQIRKQQGGYWSVIKECKHPKSEAHVRAFMWTHHDKKNSQIVTEQEYIYRMRSHEPLIDLLKKIIAEYEFANDELILRVNEPTEIFGDAVYSVANEVG
jgi:hypothetical protein